MAPKDYFNRPPDPVGQVHTQLSNVDRFLLAHAAQKSKNPIEWETLSGLRYLAGFIGCSYSTAGRWVKTGKIPAYKIGGTWYFLIQEVIESIKNQVRIRRPYSTIFENLPRRASFAGSVNSREFLTDTSGSRRFLCFEVSRIRVHSELSIDKVYAQALALYRSGFQFWLNAEEIEMINQNNEKFREVSLEEEQLFKYYRPCKRFEADEILKASEILDIIFFNYKNLINNGSLQRLGKILSSSGFYKFRRQGVQAYCLKRQGQNEEGYTSEQGGFTDLQGIQCRVGNLFSQNHEK